MRHMMLFALVAACSGCEFEGEELGKAEAALTGAGEVMGGLEHSCAHMNDGTLTCWGAVPFTLPAGFLDGVFAEHASGSRHRCGMRLDGTVECVGNDSHGEASAPGVVMSSIAAGDGFSCGIRAVDQQIVCWGRDDYGQASPPPGEYARVKAGRLHACAERADGMAVDCWGYNADQRADGLPSPVLDFAPGGYHTCYARASDGSVVCAGNGRVLTNPPGPSEPFAQLAAGTVHTCGVRSDNGHLRCWGSNTHAQVINWNYDSGIVDIGAGSYHTCVVRGAGDVLCFGLDHKGQSTVP